MVNQQKDTYALQQETLRFSFTNEEKQGYIPITHIINQEVPIYNQEVGYGFVNLTSALPPRIVHSSNISLTDSGLFFNEPYFANSINENPDDYNHFGIMFRANVPPGAYKVSIKTSTPISDVLISISGMRPQTLNQELYWDAAKLVKRSTFATTTEYEWTFDYANGRDFIDIEIEPTMNNVTCGIKEIIISPMSNNNKSSNERPTLFLLGDSTVKSYIFEEAPMNGWGQVINQLFDLEKVNIINYSMGGRSFKNSYSEGRLNDILMTGKEGDYLFIQFGHNDESTDESDRFGRGSTEQMYASYIHDIFIPAIRARGIIPIFVTPMSRIDGTLADDGIYHNSFHKRKFPDILKKAGEELQIPVIDLNTRSLEYYNEIGPQATSAMFMSIEAGETPGKTNDGTYANGHPANKIDGTHYKESLSHQFSRIIVTEIVNLGKNQNEIMTEISSFLKDDVVTAAQQNKWGGIFTQCATDVQTGPNAYYRNQIEKLIQLNVLEKDQEGNFNPEAIIEIDEFCFAICKLLSISIDSIKRNNHTKLTREVMAAILYDAYHARFQEKPKYMTAYNDIKKKQSSVNYDSNLDFGGSTTYYPLIPYENLDDFDDVNPKLRPKVKTAYQLGLIRSDYGIQRGKVLNGKTFEPKQPVTKAKAAKTLYFMWVLSNPINVENHLSEIAPASDKEETVC
ncbi:SGNH/GDSL hydrolase family protein [Fredinandcohnia onubensis]|uniref:SGNH/GDSL hydrolase family protein n=1 Tax=Fredinandcohnia onubensis TaxID=1571209 RepID=UPI000C0BF1C2|nr:SGNH/GDSL hydrolase family protein [Fredinandcohnia onubensis]